MTKIVVGVDGSEHSTHALEWCARYAEALEAEIVVVHAIEIPISPAVGFGAAYAPIMPACEPNPTEMESHIERDWCEPLRKVDAKFRVVCTMGVPAVVIMQIARREEADLVVAGRRGRGGFVELLLGSTSHQLSHDVDRPLVIVP